MKQLVICICLLIVVTSTSCKFSGQTQTAAQQYNTDPNKTDVITLFFTGNELGELRPCGCSGGQLGGLERRTAIFNKVSKDKRMLIATGSLVKNENQQDRIKFDILFRAFNLLGYDLLSLSEKDAKIIENYFGSTEYFEPSFQIISAAGFSELKTPVKFTKTISLADKKVDITVLSINNNSYSSDQIRKLLSNSVSRANHIRVNILIVNGRESDFLDAIKTESDIIDCVVVPATADQPMLISEPGQKPLIFSVGRFGRYIAAIKIKPVKGIGQTTLPVISFESQTVTEDLPQDMYMVSLYKDYQKIVADSNLVEQYPRYIYPGELKYTGSASCSGEKCHANAFMEWLKQAHSHAYLTLDNAGSSRDPECVICHVVGLEYKSGFVSVEKTPLLIDVGCEVCHGPGSAHHTDPNKIKMPILEPNTVCIKCHTPEHSNDYNGHEKEKLALIKHWTEPNQPAIVKKE